MIASENLQIADVNAHLYESSFDIPIMGSIEARMAAKLGTTPNAFIIYVGIIFF
jgi:hypothetical protein